MEREPAARGPDVAARAERGDERAEPIVIALDAVEREHAQPRGATIRQEQRVAERIDACKAERVWPEAKLAQLAAAARTFIAAAWTRTALVRSTAAGQKGRTGAAKRAEWLVASIEDCVAGGAGHAARDVV